MKEPKETAAKPEETGMIEAFRYLTGKLEPEERRSWRILTVLNFISPVIDLFSFSAIILIVNRMGHGGQASPKQIAFVVCMVGVSALKCLFDLYKSKLSNQFVLNSAQKLSMKVYELLIKEDLLSHQRKTAMQAAATVRQDTTTCVQLLVTCIQIWVNFLVMTGYAAILSYAARWLGLASAAALILVMVWRHFRSRKQMRAYGEASRSYSIQANSQITIAHGSFKEMKIDGRSVFALKNYQSASTGYAQAQSEYQYRSASTGIILQNSVNGVLFAVLAVILLAGSNLAALLAPMMAYITALVRMLQMVRGVLSGLNSVEFSKKSFAELRESFAKYEKIKVEEARLEPLRQKELTFRQGLSVKHLTFGYNEHVKIFEDASIDIPVGRSTAIIGVSGAGKTTFLDLILGLLRPQEGSIFYDDYDIVSQTDGEGSCKANIGQLVSYIPQTVYLNGETVRHNVAFFEEEQAIDGAKVEECLKCAQIWEDVQRLPDGVNTLIGENGATISGGQRQRIALARALYKDFELLIMDEATAALDMETERAVIDSIRQVKEGKTLLMVTHHMSLANECDLIYKIENRKIVRVKG